MGKSAVKLCKAAAYVNAGTVEFLVDQDGSYYFMEVNSRIQVEHPVTETVTGIDLIKAQIRIAAGEPLGLEQKDIQIKGSAIECRINAEDPNDSFRPCPGRITTCIPPGGPGVRLDSHIYSGYEVPQYYDSMLGKLICRGNNRDEAIATMTRALDEFTIEGVKTTIPLLRDLLRHPDFRRGEFDTSFLETRFLGG
jgi:acetyl-CoA carboxylase biotin carboxylase subunit